MPEPLIEAGIEALCRADPDSTDCFGATAAEVLTKYIEEIEAVNPVYGLVGAQNRQELAVKHILDALAPLGCIRRLLREYPGAAVADVGSGAGLPGIPLALCLQEHPFTLIEGMQKRTHFLFATAALLGLSNVTVEKIEMERAVPGRFQLVTFRAFKPLEPKRLQSLFRLLAPGGILAAYKGRRSAIDAEMQKIAPFVGGWEALPLTVPFLSAERHLVTIRPKT